MKSTVWLSIVWGVGYVIATLYSHIVVGLGLMSLVVLTWLLSRHRETFRSWWKVDVKAIGLGLVVGAVTAGATHGLLPVLTDAVPFIADDVARVRAASGASFVLLPAVALIAVTEEVLWRGLAIDAMPTRWGPVRRAGVATAIYAAAQVGCFAPALVGVALGLGALWSAMRLWTGSLWASVIAHLMWTLTMVYVPLL